MNNLFQSKRDNGIEIISVQEPGLHSVSIGMYFNAGILYESKSTNGISHLVEHLFFRKMADLLQKEIYFGLESLGSTLRGKTYYNFIQFELSVSPKYLRQAFDIIINILSEFDWKINDINLEKKVVIKQIEYKSISFSEYVDSLYFKNLNYAMPIMGSSDIISKLTLKKINNWKHQIINPSNLCFVLTGNYNNKDFQYIFEKLSIIPPRQTEVLAFTEQTPNMFCKRNSYSDKVIETDNEISDISIIFDIDKLIINSYAVDLLCSILGGGNGSKLSLSLREEYVLTDEVFSRIDSYPELSKLTIEFSTNNTDIIQSLDLVFLGIAMLKENITNSDLAGSISFFTENQLWLLDDPQALNFSIGWQRVGLKKEYVGAEDLITNYNLVSTQDLIYAANTLFAPHNLSIAVTNNNSIIKTKKLKKYLSCLREKISQ